MLTLTSLPILLLGYYYFNCDGHSSLAFCTADFHVYDDIMMWKRCTNDYCPLHGEFTGLPVDSPHKGQLCVVLMFSLIQPVEHTAKLPMTLLWRHCIVFNPREYLSPHIANDVSMWIAHLWNIYLHIISDGELILRDETLNLKSSTQQSTAIIRVVIMGAMASQTASLTIVYSTVYSGRSQKISKLCFTGLCAGNSPVTSEFPSQIASNAKIVSIWWRHHD